MHCLQYNITFQMWL